MRKRIKELATQAGMQECRLGYGMPENVLWGESDIEQFAQLIVQECIDLARQQRDPAQLNYKPSERFAEALELHFGVQK